MIKKIFFPILMAILLAATAFAPALANEDRPPSNEGNTQRFWGEVTSVEGNQFKVERPNGDRTTVSVNPDTQYRFRDGTQASFSDISVGRWVAGAGHGGENGVSARIVVILPDGFEPPSLIRAAGEIISVSGNGFSLRKQNGEVVSLLVDENTHFRGVAGSLAELEVGMLAGVGARQSENGSLVAVVVITRERPERPEIHRFVGTIHSSNPGANRFTLDTRDGERITFAVTDRTQFRGQVSGLGDLKPGMAAGVGAYQDENGGWTAIVVVAGDLPEPGQRAAGKVTSVGSNSFTMINRGGEEMTFSVTDSTRFVSRNGEIDGLEDLRVGMLVGVIYETSSDGRLIARVVGVRIPENDTTTE